MEPNLDSVVASAKNHEFEEGFYYTWSGPSHTLKDETFMSDSVMAREGVTVEAIIQSSDGTADEIYMLFAARGERCSIAWRKTSSQYGRTKRYRTLTLLCYRRL